MKLKLTDEQIRELLARDGIIPGKSMSVKNYLRTVHAIKNYYKR